MKRRRLTVQLAPTTRTDLMCIYCGGFRTEYAVVPVVAGADEQAGVHVVCMRGKRSPVTMRAQADGMAEQRSARRNVRTLAEKAAEKLAPLIDGSYEVAAANMMRAFDEAEHKAALKVEKSAKSLAATARWANMDPKKKAAIVAKMRAGLKGVSS